MTRFLSVAFAVSVLSATGCSTMSNTEKGVGIGGALGAATGLAIGAATGNPKTGALVGGLAGAGLGGLVGNDADQRDKERGEARQAAAIANAPAPQAPLGLTDIVKLNQQNVDADVIVEQIRATGSTFQLSTGDIEYLTQCQVNPKVIHAMQLARGGTTTVVVPQRRIYVSDPYYVAPVYYPPPPPPGIYFHGRGRW